MNNGVMTSKECVMEVGNIPKFEQFANFSQTKTEKVQQAHETSLLNEEVQNRNIQNPELVREMVQSKETKKVEPTVKEPLEFIISNVNFGYNEESKDFYVKVNRSDYFAQYPTDEMMRLKAYLMSLNEERIA